jgi:hypothetical protein
MVVMAMDIILNLKHTRATGIRKSIRRIGQVPRKVHGKQ